MKVVKYEKVETLEKRGKNELLEQFSNEELMQMIIDRLGERKNA